MDEKKKTTMSVPEMRHMLGLGKTAGYWLVHKQCFQTIMVHGKMRVVIDSFEKWYANQIKYKKVNGTPPGEELKSYSYSIAEVADILDVSSETVYEIIKRYDIETFEVDYWKRIRKDIFDIWYQGQTRYRNAEDKIRDEEIERETMTMPEMARLLLVTRNEVYQILNAVQNTDVFQMVIVAEKKRVTKESFEKWYSSQSKYRKLCDRSPEEQAEILAKQYEAEKLKEAKRFNSEEKLRISLDKSVYTVQEVAILLDLSYKDVLSLIQEETIEAKKYGNKYLIHRDEITWFLLQQQMQLDV